MEDNGEILQRMAVKQAEIANDVKHLVKSFDNHVVSDEAQFKKSNNDIDWMKRIMYGGIGIVIFLQMIDKIGPALAQLIN